MEATEQKMANFGANVRRIRLERNMRPEELAAKAGISMTTLNRVEGMAGTPGFDIVLNILEVLGVELAPMLQPADGQSTMSETVNA